MNYFSESTCGKDICWMVKGLWVTFLGTVNWRRFLARHGLVMLLDVLIVAFSFACALLFRYGGILGERTFAWLLTGVWLLPCIVVGVMIAGGAYKTPMRYFAVGDAIRLARTVTLGWTLGYLTFLGFFFRGTSISLAPMGLILSLVLMASARIAYRERYRQKIKVNADLRKGLVIYGAGERGQALAELLTHGFKNVDVLGFIEDSADYSGRSIGDHKVLGSERDLSTMYKVKRFDHLWVSFSPSAQKLQRIENWSAENNVDLVVFPEIGAFQKLEKIE